MAATKDFRHGHRERVRARYLREGLYHFADYEVLELLLFYAIPRRDTKGMAHALIDAFGSLYAVLHADERELCRVDGIGPRTAAFLRSLYPFVNYVAKEEPQNVLRTDVKSLAQYFYSRIPRTEDVSAVAFLNNKNEVIRYMPLGKGKAIFLIDYKRVVSLAFAYRASSVVFFDYKKDGIPFPDETVLQGIRNMRMEMADVGLNLCEYVLLAEKQYSSVFSVLGDASAMSPSRFLLQDTDENQKPPYSLQSLSAFKDLLSFIMPKEKADALAETLLEKYGALSFILSIPYETLLEENEEEGYVLLYLKILLEMYSFANLSLAKHSKDIYTNAQGIGSMLCGVIGMACEENIFLALFDKDMRLIDLVRCAKGTVNTASVPMRTLMETVVLKKAVYVALAHNHPGGDAVPSSPDLALTTMFSQALGKIHVPLLEHFVVTSRDFLMINHTIHKQHSPNMPAAFYEKPDVSVAQ